MSDEALRLSPTDHVFTGTGAYAIEFSFAYGDRLDPDRLRASLDRTLETFWPLRSKLTRVEAHTFGLQPAGDGVVFRTRRSSDTFEDVAEVSAFVDPVHSVEGEPLTRITLTQTARGSVLGLSISHALVDGFSLFHFLTSWSRCFQGKRMLAPSCDRGLLTPETASNGGQVTADELLTRCGLFWAGKRRPVSGDRIREERTTVSKEAIDGLLAEARRQGPAGLYPNDVLTALLWKRCLPQWEDGAGNPTTYMSCPVDFRRILRGVPRTYFGNALCFATASIDYRGLASASLGELALLIREAVGRVRQDYVSGSLETLERLRRERGLGVMEEVHVVAPRHGMLVTNISRLPVQGLDFGAGVPTGLRALSSTQRAAAILPAEDGVEIRVFHPVG